MKRRKLRESPFKRITIIGVGLIGGSFGLAVKRRFRLVHITGYDTPHALRRAVLRGAIDLGNPRLEEAVRFADLVVLATPISSVVRLLPRIARSIPPRVLVTDVCSVKSEVIRKATLVFPRGNFIGGHPMAGSERSGVEAANPLLFENAMYLLTPMKRTPKRTVKLLSTFLRGLGAKVLLLDADTHDSAVSAVSHIVQLAAVALVRVAGKTHRLASNHLSLAAGGFRDTTRVASSPYPVWHDILLFNRKEILKSLKLYIRELEAYASALHSHHPSLRRQFLEARRLRETLFKKDAKR